MSPLRLIVLSGITVLLGVGVARLHVNTGLIDWLPRSSPNVQAFGALFENLEGVIHQEVLWLELDPEKARRAGVTSITDPEVFRAQQELLEHVQATVPDVKGYFGLLSLMKMARAVTSADGQPERPESLPGTDLEMQLLWRGLQSVSPELIRSLMSTDPETEGTLLTLVIDGPPLSEKGHRAARGIQTALASYLLMEPEYDLFREEYLVTSGLSSGTASLNDTLKWDLILLTPVAGLLLLVILRLSLGSGAATLSVVGVTLVGLIWTLGLMGWMGTPLNVITFSLIPLILGCGVDYAILMSLDTLDHRREGLSAENALKAVRQTSTLPILLTTLTTTAGLSLLIFNDSYGIATLGLHATLGMLALAYLSTRVLPQLLMRVPPPPPSRLGPILAPVAASIRRNRIVVLLVVGVITAASLVVAREPHVLLDVIQGNYPPDSPIARVSDRILDKCGGAFPEIIIAQGDLASPEALEELRQIREDLKADPHIGERFEVVAPVDILESFQQLSEPRSLLGAFLGGGPPPATLPDEREEILELARTVHGRPHWSTFAGLFFTPDLQVGTLLLLGGDAGTDVESVERVWTALEEQLDGRGRETGIEYSFLGYRTMAYLFANHSETWLYWTLVASVITVLLISLVVLRRPRYVLVMGLLVTLGGVWWLAFLQVAGIPMSIFLMFPLVFALCVSSDYGLHLLCRLRADRRAHEASGSPGDSHAWSHRAWSTTGRAIAIAALTDGLIFLIFWKMTLVSASRVMLAASLAVVAVFACTMLLVPALALPSTRTRRSSLSETTDHPHDSPDTRATPHPAPPP